MVKTCCVYKCRNRANSVAKVNNISFFRFPANKKKLQAWIKAVNREDWEPNGHTNICSDHFVFGWHSDDPNDDNYAPTLFIQKENKKLKKLGKKNDKIASYKSPEKSTASVEEITNFSDAFSMLTRGDNPSSSTDSATDPPCDYLNTELVYPDHLKDHLYCKAVPWPGPKRKQKHKKSQTLSRESAAETLLSLCQVQIPNKDDSRSLNGDMHYSSESFNPDLHTFSNINLEHHQWTECISNEFKIHNDNAQHHLTHISSLDSETEHSSTHESIENPELHTVINELNHHI
ncbi:THAP domain-containing protein 3-like [Mytilus edulis]|uniref:THAP domain-containing protein 3-like n=1 Tax=Mytilus edulis TaxID=6550 RepID=UPI0039F066D4